jgi:hypothetical protein
MLSLLDLGSIGRALSVSFLLRGGSGLSGLHLLTGSNFLLRRLKHEAAAVGFRPTRGSSRSS